jgi:hypothetical protein
VGDLDQRVNAGAGISRSASSAITRRYDALPYHNGCAVAVSSMAINALLWFQLKRLIENRASSAQRASMYSRHLSLQLYDVGHRLAQCVHQLLAADGVALRSSQQPARGKDLPHTLAQTLVSCQHPIPLTIATVLSSGLRFHLSTGRTWQMHAARVVVAPTQGAVAAVSLFCGPTPPALT